MDSGQDSAGTRASVRLPPTELGGNVTFKPIRFLSLTGSYTFLDFDDESRVRTSSTRWSDRTRSDADLSRHARHGSCFDWRPAPSYSTRGGFYRAVFERNDEAAGQPFSFSPQEYEVVQQVPLVREQFVLAGARADDPDAADDGHAVPVIMAPFLGSGSTLRGFPTRRFTDRNRVLLTGEYRWRPSRYIDMAIFVDAGTGRARSP